MIAQKNGFTLLVPAEEIKSENLKGHVRRVSNNPEFMELIYRTNRYAGRSKNLEPETMLIQIGQDANMPMSGDLEKTVQDIIKQSVQDSVSTQAKGLLIRSDRGRAFVAALSHNNETLSRETVAETIISVLMEELGEHERNLLRIWATELRHRLLELRNDEQRAKELEVKKRRLTVRINDTNLLKVSYGEMVSSAAKGEFDPVVERDQEIDWALNILRDPKSNLVLVGKSGVGKTAVVQAIAQRIASCRNVPIELQNIRIYGPAFLYSRSSIDQILNEINLARLRRDPVRVILFIDPIRSMARNAMFDKLYPSFSNGEIQIIGEATEKDYLEFKFEKSFLKFFSELHIEEPASNITELMLLAGAPRLANFHGLEILPDAIPAAVRFAPLSHHPVNPSAAYNWLDLTCAKVKSLKSVDKPLAIQIIDEDIRETQHIIEEMSVSMMPTQSDLNIKARQAERLTKLKLKRKELQEQIDKERFLLDKFDEMRSNLEESKNESYDKQLEDIQNEIAKLPERHCHDVVDSAAIMSTVSQETKRKFLELKNLDTNEIAKLISEHHSSEPPELEKYFRVDEHDDKAVISISVSGSTSQEVNSHAFESLRFHLPKGVPPIRRAAVEAVELPGVIHSTSYTATLYVAHTALPMVLRKLIREGFQKTIK